MKSVLDKQSFIRQIYAKRLINTKDHVLACVSGGADSTALARLLHLCSDELDLTVSIAHVDHSLRPDSGADAAFVRSLARELGMRFVSRKLEPGSLAGDSLENRARMARYEFFEEQADELGCQVIAMGHTADDQVETFLMRLMRGSSTAGLKGIPARRGRIRRPLLDLSRASIRNWLKGGGYTWREDPSNEDTKFVRNRVRHVLLPMLRRDFNPSVDRAIWQTLSVAGREDAFLSVLAGREEANAKCHASDSLFALNIEKLLSMPEAISRRILVRSLGRVLGYRRVRFSMIGECIELMHGKNNRDIEITKELHVSFEHGMLVGYKPRQTSYEVPVSVPGNTDIIESGMIFSAKRISSGPPAEDVWQADVALVKPDYMKSCIVRSRRAGDRVKPLGMNGTKKIQDLMTDRKISRRLRDRIPLVVCGGRVIWVRGLALDRNAAVCADATDYIKLEFSQI